MYVARLIEVETLERGKMLKAKSVVEDYDTASVQNYMKQDTLLLKS